MTGKRILTTRQLKRLRIDLKKLGVDLVIVSRKSPKTKALWKKMALGQTKEGKRVLGMFKPATGKSRKFGITLEGPKLYVLDEAYAYTVAHEMKHIELWYKMIKEFPELAKTYNKISQLLHEEYVLSKLVKENKWALDDLLLDLKTVNWHRKQAKLSPVSLDYYKNWNITDHIKNL